MIRFRRHHIGMGYAIDRNGKIVKCHTRLGQFLAVVAGRGWFKSVKAAREYLNS